MAARDKQIQKFGDVAHLAFGVEDQAAAVRQVRTGTVHAEQVGITGSVMPRYADGRSPTLAEDLAARPTIVIGHSIRLA